MGDDYSGYYIVASTHRDADDIVSSNFSSIKKTLDDKEIVYIDIRFNHWVVGWIEQLMIHEGDDIGLSVAEELNVSIEDYPILDDDDYNERRNDRVYEYYKEYRSSGDTLLSFFGERSIRGYMKNYEIKRVRDLKKRNVLEIIEYWWMD